MLALFSVVRTVTATAFLFTPPMWAATIAILRVVGRVWLSLLRPLFCFAVYVPKPAAFAASEPRAPFLVHVIPWRTSEILFKDFYHVLSTRLRVNPHLAPP